jgi:branched-chain amino acid transport system substrate-binding protein
LCVGIEAMADCFVDLWNQIPTNKKVGLLYTNTTDGQAWGDEQHGGPFFFKQGGYDYTMPGFFQPGAEDFTAQISEFKKFGAEICSGACPSTDFTNFWKQCIQQGFRPKICTVGQALNFAETVTAIGPTAYGLTTEITWHPAYPYKSALSGETCREIAEDYEKRTGRQWSAELMVYALMEWFVDALKRTKNVDDKEELIGAISSAKVETIYGPVDFTLPVDPKAQGAVTRPVHNCLRMPIGAGQWLKGEKWPFEKFLVSNKYVPGAEISRKIEEIRYEG